MTKVRSFPRLLIPLTVLLLLAACTTPPPAQIAVLTATPASAPTAEPLATVEAGGLPAAVEYDLGETTIVQERFAEGDSFRNMPVRLNGVIAVPAEGDGPFPVVMIIHGTHPGCPEVEKGVDRWPCDPAVEQRNYSGFAYLASALAAQGYIVLAPNFNAEHTFGFGEPTPDERLTQVFDLHLQGLAEAAAGGANGFGVDLAGRADLGRLALFGHSRGGGSAVGLANNPELMAASRGYGPAAGVLLIAGATAALDPWSSVSAPLATILAACDGDVTDQAGQFFFEGPRLAPDQTEWAASAWLERANHNSFNTILPGDMITLRDRPDCETLLDGEAQRAWLVDYAGDFLTTLFAGDAAAVDEAKARMGLDVHRACAGYALRVAGPRSISGAGRQPETPDDPGPGGGTRDQPAGRRGYSRERDHPLLPQSFLFRLELARQRAVPAQLRDGARPAGARRGRLGETRRRAALHPARGRRRPERLRHAQPARGCGSGLAAQRSRQPAGLQRTS